MDVVDPRILALILTAVGWGSREFWCRREARRQAAHDAGHALTQNKALLEEIISKAEDPNDKNNLVAQLDEVNAALLGLYAQRIRQTLKDAGLPTEEVLIANGRSRLQPKQLTRLQAVIAGVKALPPFLSTQDLMLLGDAYYHMQQYEDAKIIYDQILNLDPDDPDVLNNRGIIYRKLERYDEALSDLNHSLQIRPDHPSVLMNRGNVYNGLGRYEEALADCNRSLKLRPDDPDTLGNRGITYGHLKRYEEALADLKRSLELRPDDPDTLYNLACLFSLWGKTDDALTYLKKAIEGDNKYREMAKTDEDFNNIRDAPRFKKLIESD